MGAVAALFVGSFSVTNAASAADTANFASGPYAAEGWTTQTVTTSDELLEPRTSLALNPTSGSVVVDANGVRHMAYVDGGAIKVVSSAATAWGIPVTAVTAAEAGEVKDLHLVTQAGELTLVWLNEATEGLFDKQRISYRQTRAGTWSGAVTVFRSAIYVTKNISIAPSGTDVYVAYQRAGNAIAGNFEPLIYRIPAGASSANPGAELPVLPDVTYINDGYLVASGPHHLAYVWAQEEGFASPPPWELSIAFFDLRTQQWSAVQTLADKVSDLTADGSANPSASGATGVIVWEDVDGDRRVATATLRGGSVDTTRAVTPFNLRSVEHLQAAWNASADAAVAACFCRANLVPSAESYSVTGFTIPSAGEIPASTKVSQQNPTSVRRLDLQGPQLGALTATITWQDGDRSNPHVFATSYGSGGWSAAADQGSGQWPLAVPSSGPDILWWGVTDPYVLTNAVTSHTPRPDPGPDPGPEPVITVQITGVRTATTYIAINGTTTGVTDGASAVTSIKKVKRGQRWKKLEPVTVNVNRAGEGSFRTTFKAGPKFKYKAYVKVDGMKSNVVTIGKGR